MEVEKVEDVEDEDSAAESRLALKVASFGMAAGAYYTLGRIQSEAFRATSGCSSSCRKNQFDNRRLPMRWLLGHAVFQTDEDPLSNSCKFSIGLAKIPEDSRAFRAISAPLRYAKICQE